MTYAHLFDQPVSDVELPADIMVDMEQLSPEQTRVVLCWIKEQADRAAAAIKLREVLKQALFDVTAAELGALLHKPGNS